MKTIIVNFKGDENYGSIKSMLKNEKSYCNNEGKLFYGIIAKYYYDYNCNRHYYHSDRKLYRVNNYRVIDKNSAYVYSI